VAYLLLEEELVA